MSRLFLHCAGSFWLVCATVAAPGLACAQAAAGNAAASVVGVVWDAEHRPIAGAAVILESSPSGKPISTTSDAQGRYKFTGLALGSYTLRVKQVGFGETIEGPFVLKEHDAKSVTLLLKKAGGAEDLPFSDEMHFTVAGVTDTTSLGGHGSDPVRRNSDALSKQAAQLTDENAGAPDEASLRAQLAKADDAALRFQLAEIEEKSGRSLDAVNDYQRAAQLDPSEPHLFAWGAELLLHRAFDPSVEVFGKGRKLYPNSVRIMLGLGAALYAKGSAEEANQILMQACDVAPADPTPYLFMGRVQATANELPAGWTERLKRFAEKNPQNAQAHYDYAIALTKKPSAPDQVALAIAQLKTAVELDNRFGDAYLELGILTSQQGDLTAATAYLQKAVQNTALPDDAHYRLAQIYRRMGETAQAKQETELYQQASEKKKQQVEQERHELQQFVYTLREQAPVSQQNSAPQK